MNKDISLDELQHHGIKGQRWGIRRFQKKDGTLTPAGKKRYSEDSKSRHRQNLEANYRAKGLSKEEAEAAASKRIKIEKIVAVTAGVTVGACAAYYAKNKWIADRTDIILKAGTSFHNLDSKANPRPGEHLYVNYRQNDRNYFNGHFAVNKMRKSGHVFEHRIEAIDDVKIPSLKTRQSVFKQLCEKDPEFKKAIADHSGLNPNLPAKTIYKNMWNLFGDKDTPYFNEAKHKYFKALQEKGYSAIVDELDTKASVFRSDAPLILLNTSHKSLGDMTIKELKTKDVLVAQANRHNHAFKNDMLNIVSAPHTNHFKESSDHLKRYSKMSNKNREYVETAVFKRKYGNGLFTNERYINEKIIKNEALARRGKEYAYAGKYLTKNKDMSANEAFAKARKKFENRKKIDRLVTTATGEAAVISAGLGAGYAKRKSMINTYRKDHPNTKMSDDEIVKLLERR